MLADILQSLNIDVDMTDYIVSIFDAAKEENEDVDFDMVAEMLESTGVEDVSSAISQIKHFLGVTTSNIATEDVAEVQLLTTKMSLNCKDDISSSTPLPLPPPPSFGESNSPPTTVNKEESSNQGKDQSRLEWEAEVALQESLDDTDSFATAWQECLAAGNKWGGRGFGGRGSYVIHVWYIIHV